MGNVYMMLPFPILSWNDPFFTKNVTCRHVCYWKYILNLPLCLAT